MLDRSLLRSTLAFLYLSPWNKEKNEINCAVSRNLEMHVKEEVSLCESVFHFANHILECVSTLKNSNWCNLASIQPFHVLPSNNKYVTSASIFVMWVLSDGR